MPTHRPKIYLSVYSVAALGIGSMVGAGIFALMGQAVLAAGNGVYYSFLIGGAAALLSGYSYARLGSRFPGSGGIMDYFDKAFPKKIFSGMLCILYLLTLAITCCLIAKSFGAYATRLVFPDHQIPFWGVPIFSSSILIFLGAINMVGAGAAGKSEVVLVAFKLMILFILISAGVDHFLTSAPLPIDPLEPGSVSVPGLGVATAHGIAMRPEYDWSVIFGSVGLTFFAYAGYGMMANTTGNLRDPQKTLPRAIFLSISIVILLYVVLSFIVVKTIPAHALKNNMDTAIAETAYPLLGRWGTIAVSIAALIASASAINATLFSFIRISQKMAEKRQLNRSFENTFWRHGSKGFIVTMLCILVSTNLFDLTAIANIASATFLICYMAVFAAHWKLRRATSTSPIPIISGALLMASILIAFLYHIYNTQPAALGAIVLFILLSLLIEVVIRKKQSTLVVPAKIPL